MIIYSFPRDEMDISSGDRNNTKFDYANFYEDNPCQIFMSDSWLSIIYLNKAKHLKTNKQTTNASNIALNKIVGLVHPRR